MTVWLHVSIIFLSIGLLLIWWMLHRLCRVVEDMCAVVRPSALVATTDQRYIIRCERAGVFYAFLAGRRGSEADLVDARRIHYWDGAASLSQMAVDGIGKPDQSRVTVTVPSMTVLGVIEVIPCSDKACASIDAVEDWRV